MKYLFILLIFIFTSYNQAQDNTFPKSVFISGGMGIYNSSSPHETAVNGLPNIFFSGSFGIPLSSRLYFYNRISYSSKSNFTAYERIEPVNDLVQATASFSQLIYNSGLRYRIFSAERWGIAFEAGFTYSLVNHEAVLKGEMFQKLDDQSFYGYFGGIDAEYKFEDSKFSLFGEAQYNHIGTDKIYYRDKFSGMNFTFGARYYFQK